VHAQGTAGLLTGLAVFGVAASSDPATVLNQLSSAPAVAVTAPPPGAAGQAPAAARVAALRASLEAAVAAPAAGAAPPSPSPVGSHTAGVLRAAESAAGPAGEQDGDSLDELIRRATRRHDRRPS